MLIGRHCRSKNTALGWSGWVGRHVQGGSHGIARVETHSFDRQAPRVPKDMRQAGRHRMEVHPRTRFVCMFVISHVYPATFDPIGSWQVLGFYIYDQALPPSSNPL